jgi:hypothetical protein
LTNAGVVAGRERWVVVLHGLGAYSAPTRAPGQVPQHATPPFGGCVRGGVRLEMNQQSDIKVSTELKTELKTEDVAVIVATGSAVESCCSIFITLLRSCF